VTRVALRFALNRFLRDEMQMSEVERDRILISLGLRTKRMSPYKSGEWDDGA